MKHAIDLKNIKNEELELAYSCKLLAPLSPILTEKENDKYNTLVDKWIIAKKSLKNKPARELLSSVITHTSKLIEVFEGTHYKLGSSTPLEVLESFITDHNLKQRDLALEFGSQSIVSEVLRGKREISLGAARKLGKRFKVNPRLFIQL